MADKQNLLLLLDHPTEPVFMAKGKTPTVFDVPEDFLSERYRPIADEVQSSIGDKVTERIPVSDIEKPDLSVPMSLGREEQFSFFVPRHREIATRLVDIFMGARSVDELQSIAIYARDRVNPFIFNYALSVALLHREDTKDLDLPTLVQTFPDRFVDSQVLRQLREESFIVPDGLRTTINVPRDYTASDLEPEHRLWYFREDIGINLHHWHWHLVYPFEVGGPKIVDKNRRGELFFYMHQQIVARYNMERFSNNLGRVVGFKNLREPIEEGYFPKMGSTVSNRAWPPRAPNTPLSDVNRDLDEMFYGIADLEIWRERIYEAIHNDAAVDEDGKTIPLDEIHGIDVLGNMIESSLISPNRAFYGDIHNMGHVFISVSHDPNHRHLESLGIMSEAATAMRDPVFYRWHTYIDLFFQEHKTRLTPYNLQQLGYEGVTITGFKVTPAGGQPNILDTFWQQSDVDLSHGIDFVPRGSLFARFTHLQHTPFTYTINVNNDSGVQRYGTVRIYLGPKEDEHGQPIPLREQRIQLVELDKFKISLSPGLNVIRRRSTESSVTIPFERTFRSLEGTRPEPASLNALPFNFCGCGWPNHMLIPKGSPQGLPCELFVMVSNYEDDKIEQDLVGTCSNSQSYCGVRDRLYPDRRAMGFPFDRLPRKEADRLVDFLTPNMSLIDVVIRHENRTVVRPGT